MEELISDSLLIPTCQPTCFAALCNYSNFGNEEETREKVAETDKEVERRGGQAEADTEGACFRSESEEEGRCEDTVGGRKMHLFGDSMVFVFIY